jgi:hypothetical protein
MTVYYIRQDNTIWGCGDPDCCGINYEEIEERFVECKCVPESEITAEHLHTCAGGGPVLKWRTAKLLEAKAWSDGRDEGFDDGATWGIEWQKKRETE